MATILFVAQQYWPDIGGLATSGTRVSQALAQLGHQVHVVVLSSELDSGEAETETLDQHPGLQIHRFGRGKQMDFTLQQLEIFYQWLHQKFQFEIVWAHYAYEIGFSGIWFAQSNSIPSALSLRGNDVDRQLFPPGNFGRLNWMLEHATELVSVSRDLATKVHTLVGRNATVLYNSVDSNLFRPDRSSSANQQRLDLREQYAVSPEELLLVFSGELRSKKGMPILIEALRQLAVRRPTKLMIIGAVRAKEKSDFSRWTADIPKEAIIRTGHLSQPAQVVDHLRAGDIFLLPSLWEGLPNSLLEAMATGIPVIASDAGAIKEVLVDGETGVSIPRSQLHTLANRVDRFFTRPAAERDTITTKARQHMQQNFAPDTEREQLQAIVDRLT